LDKWWVSEVRRNIERRKWIEWDRICQHNPREGTIQIQLIQQKWKNYVTKKLLNCLTLIWYKKRKNSNIKMKMMQLPLPLHHIRSVYTIGTRFRWMTKTTKLPYLPFEAHVYTVHWLFLFLSCCNVKLIIHIGQPSWRY